MKAKIIAGLCAVVLLGGAAGGVFAWQKISRLKTANDTLAYQLETANAAKNDLQKELEKYIHPVVRIDVKQLEKEIGKISELATIEYRYKEQYAFKGQLELDLNDLLKNVDLPIPIAETEMLEGIKIPLPLTDKELTVNMEGVIKAGIDFSKMELSCDEDKKEILIRLPASEYLSNELDEESLETISEKNSFFNQLTTQDQNLVRKRIKENALENADKNKTLQQADERARLLITDIIEATPNVKDNYKIRFETIE